MPLGTPIVQRTVEYITKHYADKLTLDELAKSAGCSTVYLSKCFKMYMGRSVHQYLTEYRISRAAALLHTGCSVTDTCYGVGFSDCSSFIRTFQKMMKTTPHQYKKSKAE
jgi:YesN/AraC family two-component response regulator